MVLLFEVAVLFAVVHDRRKARRTRRRARRRASRGRRAVRDRPDPAAHPGRRPRLGRHHLTTLEHVVALRAVCRRGGGRLPERLSAAATRSRSTTSRSRRARRSRTGTPCWSARRPAPGKTVVGEFAVHLALAAGQKCFYTTPIKALSNQKYNDLVARYGTAAGRPADRRQLGQRRRADRRHDHRGAAQHALRRQHLARRSRLRRDGRGALPRRPVPRRRLGRGDHPPARVGAAGQPVRDRVATPRSSASGWCRSAARRR